MAGPARSICRSRRVESRVADHVGGRPSAKAAHRRRRRSSASRPEVLVDPALARGLVRGSRVQSASQTRPSGNASATWPTSSSASSARAGRPELFPSHASSPSRSASRSSQAPAAPRARRSSAAARRVEVVRRATPAVADRSRTAARCRSAMSRCQHRRASRGQPPGGMASSSASPAHGQLSSARVGRWAPNASTTRAHGSMAMTRGGRPGSRSRCPARPRTGRSGPPGQLVAVGDELLPHGQR